jgi:hypothetical protein
LRFETQVPFKIGRGGRGEQQPWKRDFAVRDFRPTRRE